MLIADFYFVIGKGEIQTRESFNDGFLCSEACGEVRTRVSFREAVGLFGGGETKVEKGLLL